MSSDRTVPGGTATPLVLPPDAGPAVDPGSDTASFDAPVRVPAFEPEATQAQHIHDLVTPCMEHKRACLVVLHGKDIGRRFELPPEGLVLGRGEDVSVPVLDTAASRRHAEIKPSPLGWMITDQKSTNGLYINGQRTKHRVLAEGDRIQIGSTVLKFSFEDALEEGLRRKLYDSATRDALTGLHNKRFFLESLELAFAHADRRDAPLSVLVLDIDYFKMVNDEYGHLVGDVVLKEVAAVLQGEVRQEDLLARFGGEEFVLLMRETGPEAAQALAERVRRRVEEKTFDAEGKALTLTLSVGGATLRGRNFAGGTGLFECADAALYEAKRAGRNRTVFRGECRPDDTPVV